MYVSYTCPACQTEQLVEPGQRLCLGCGRLLVVPRPPGAAWRDPVRPVVERPLGVVLVVLRCASVALADVYAGLLILLLFPPPVRSAPALLLALGLLVLAPASGASAWGLWHLAEWGRRWALVLLGGDLVLVGQATNLLSECGASVLVVALLCFGVVVDFLLILYLLSPHNAERFSFG